jgi:hypothetical protein
VPPLHFVFRGFGFVEAPSARVAWLTPRGLVWLLLC